MASDGLANRAKRGKCRICLRVRDTEKHVKAVGEVHHGFAVGYIWECKDAVECEARARDKLEEYSRPNQERNIIQLALAAGRFKHYKIFN